MRALRSLLCAAALAGCGDPAPGPAGGTVTTGTQTGDQETGGSSETGILTSGGPDPLGVTSNDASGPFTSDTGNPTACSPTEQGVRDSIIEPLCAIAGCHDAASAAGGLDLSIADLEATLAAAPSGTCDGEVLLVPGDPDASFLQAKIGGDPKCGGTMPPVGELDPALQQCVADWITQAQSVCETCGGATCIDVETSAEHCGDCDAPCPVGVACIEGACACPDGTEACGPECVDTLSDPEHCGGCDSPCDGGLFCLAGGCSNDCAGLSECTGACVNLENNPLHCGGCDAPCGAGETCSGSSCGCEAPPTSYATDVEPILSGSCASMGCHRPMGPNDGAADLDLTSGSGYSALVDVPSTQCSNRMLVAPGSPGSSYLLDKVSGINLCFGTKMPKTGPSLTAGELQSISDWICSGAAP